MALLCAAVLVSHLWAKVMAPPPASDRVARADVVITGKVAKIEDKTVSLPAAPGAKDKVEYQIAVVKVDDPILNAKGTKEVRVGSISPTRMVEDEELCLFLAKHHEGDFYIIPGYFDLTKKKGTANYEEFLKEVKRCATLFADPDAALKSKDANERLLTASMLLTRYATPRPGAAKQEPIDAAQSKQILLTIAEADWSADPKPNVANARQVFARLNLGPADGWTPPADVKEFPDAAKKWLKDNSETHRLKQWVPEKRDKKD
jgi:hypothetical protein